MAPRPPIALRRAAPPLPPQNEACAVTGRRQFETHHRITSGTSGTSEDSMSHRAVRLLFLLTLAACGTTSASRAESSDVLTRTEIQASRASNALELLQQLRPQFLRSRGAVSIRDPAAGYPVVYMNDVHYGDIESLRTIGVRAIDQIHFISAADATTRWGTGHAGGVIQVRARY
jgi:hypothetical protein